MSLAEGVRRDLVRRIESGEKYDNLVLTRPIKRRWGNSVAKEVTGWCLLNDKFYLFAETIRNKDAHKPRMQHLNPLLVLSAHAVARTFSRRHTIKLDHLLEEFRPLAVTMASSNLWEDIKKGFDRLKIDDESFCLRTPNGVAFCHLQRGANATMTENLEGQKAMIRHDNMHVFIRTWCSYDRLQDDTPHKKKVYDWAHNQ